MNDASLVNSLKEIAKELRLIRQELHKMNAPTGEVKHTASESEILERLLAGDEHG